MRENAVDAENDERNRQCNCDDATRLDRADDRERHRRRRAAGDRRIRDVMPRHATKEFDDQRLNEKRERCVRKWEVAIGHVAHRDPCRGFDDVAVVPEDRQARVLPHHECGSRDRKQQHRDHVALVKNIRTARMSAAHAIHHV